MEVAVKDDEFDAITRNDAPPILSLLAVLAAILVLAVVIPARSADSRRIVSVALSPVLGAIKAAYPRVFALLSQGDYEPSPGLMRLLGWLLVLWPLLLLL
jgi:hypothetical protein